MQVLTAILLRLQPAAVLLQIRVYLLDQPERAFVQDTAIVNGRAHVFSDLRVLVHVLGQRGDLVAHATPCDSSTTQSAHAANATDNGQQPRWERQWDRVAFSECEDWNGEDHKKGEEGSQQ